MLALGRDGYSRFPPEKLKVDSFYHPNKDRPGSMFTEGGYLLSGNPNAFDAPFFSVNAHEAASMAPDQKILLETVYEALESAGHSMETVSGTETGVWVGNMNTDQLSKFVKDSEYPPAYATTGSDPAILSNRVSYLFNLYGPSCMVDTACSSSLYAVNAAEAALRNGDCDMAICAGTNMIIAPEMQIYGTKLGALSRTSKCHTYDDTADGYSRAEGVGVVLLKRLSTALKDGDPIRAVIRGTAVNA